MKRADPFYKTARWERLRQHALRRDCYMCQCCKANNRMVEAQCVHHVFPRDAWPQYQYEPWNLLSLCNDCHNEMHDRKTDALSIKGMIIMRSLAESRGIEVSTKESTILVIGLSGSGKSTYCRAHMDDSSLCYDLDAIAGAFRLKAPHEEYYKPARKMANDFLQGFVVKAHDYAKRVYIIRTAPTIKELEDIRPDKVVICSRQYDRRHMDDRAGAEKRIEEVNQYCSSRGIELEIV